MNCTIVISSLDTKDYVQPLSCARVIDGFVSKRKLSSVIYYVHFYLKKAISFNVTRISKGKKYNKDGYSG